MVDPIMRLFILVALCWSTSAAAQSNLPDPTRPPGPVHGDPVTEGTSGGAAVVQSVMLPQSGRPWALIDGERVVLGGQLGDEQVVRISEEAVVLQGPDGTRTLRIVPHVEKKPSPTTMQTSVGDQRYAQKALR